MTRLRLLYLPAIVLSCAVLSEAQSFQPKTIQFLGAPQYSSTELLAAARLKKGGSLTAAEMSDSTKVLMDTGTFDNITFTFNGADLVFKMIPATLIYPVRLENLPLTASKTLDEQLHAKFPLYHGSVPTSGDLLDGIRHELEAQLATKGMKATITATPYTDMKLSKVTAMSFSITDPDVMVGATHIQGASSGLAAKAQLVASKAAGAVYSTDGSPSQLEVNLSNFYGDLGYVEARVHATPEDAPVVNADGIHVPFSVTIEEGPQYKLGGIELTPDLPVTLATFNKLEGQHSGEVVSLSRLRGSVEYVTRQYHNQGFLQAQVVTTPTYDRVQGLVKYTITVVPGPVFTMGKLRIQNVSDDVRDLVLKGWKMSKGDTFDENSILSMTATHDVNPPLERLFANVTMFYTLTLHEDTHVADVILTLERKH